MVFVEVKEIISNEILTVCWFNGSQYRENEVQKVWLEKNFDGCISAFDKEDTIYFAESNLEERNLAADSESTFIEMNSEVEEKLLETIGELTESFGDLSEAYMERTFLRVFIEVKKNQVSESTVTQLRDALLEAKKCLKENQERLLSK